jgi:ribosome modulation factor
VIFQFYETRQHASSDEKCPEIGKGAQRWVAGWRTLKEDSTALEFDYEDSIL